MKKESTQFDFIKNEHNILKFWEDINIFQQMVEKNEGSKERFRFLDGPITANAAMGLHHAYGRTLKDVFIKYNCMLGKSQQFQNGFDAQGMWVEVEVEKLLGLNDKQAILKYGLDKFTEKCMERVDHFADIQTKQSIRLGQIMDWEDSYFTNSDLNITSIWHFLKVCHERGMLAKSYKAMPWCPRCGTSLSEHEMSGSYKELTHKAVFIKLPVEKMDASILVWTTTPWTLSSNVAVAVNPNGDYLVVKTKDGNFIVGKEALKVVKGEKEVVKELKGSELVGLTYKPALNLKVQNFEHKIVAWDEVSSTDGSGAVHIAPGCGAEDYNLGVKQNLPIIIPIDEAGRFLSEFEYLAGLNTEECEELIFEKLKENGTFYFNHDFSHNYPFCWRCKTNVVFKLVSGWDIKTAGVKPDLIKAVDTVTWEPDFLKKSMMNWLENMGDWNISRRRFYGLPLPIYPCECGHVEVIGSLDELKKKAAVWKDIPHLHRPYIDEIKVKCKCGSVVDRVADVGDCWLDAGIAPFSTKKYFSDKEYFKNNFPSDVVIEMKEQIRLWFYSLLFMSVVLEGKAPYNKVVSYGTVLDEDGKKFSKTAKSYIKFDDAAEQYGADVIRYVFCSANPSHDMRFGPSMAEEARRKMIALWNSYVFFNTYAVIDKPDIANYTPKNLDITDQWLLERKNQYIEEVTKGYGEYKTHNIISATEKFIEDISNFYIRVNRRRFWKGENGDDKMNAFWSLYHAIKTVTIAVSPIAPFVTEYIWQNCVLSVEPKEAKSVMLADFVTPVFSSKKPQGLVNKVNFVQDIISIAMKIRATNNLKVKQPLRAMYVISNKDVIGFENLIKDEVNVKNIEIVSDESRFNTPYLVLDFKKAGAVLKGEVQAFKQKLEGLNVAEIAGVVSDFEKGKKVLGQPADLFVKKLAKKDGFAAETLGDTTVVLDIAMDDGLIEEGNLRELVRSIQVARQDADLDITARVGFKLHGVNTKLVDKYRDKIVAEVLATSIDATDKGEFSVEILK